jgi:hypothetical protein
MGFRGPGWLARPASNQREGKTMPRKTHAQIALLLADYNAAANDKKKAEKREKELRAEIDALDLDERTYGEWSYALGTPREILNQPAVRQLVEVYGKSASVLAAIKAAKLPVPVVPTQFTKAPIIVKPVIK